MSRKLDRQVKEHKQSNRMWEDSSMPWWRPYNNCKLRRRRLNIIVVPADMCIPHVHVLILEVEGNFGTLCETLGTYCIQCSWNVKIFWSNFEQNVSTVAENMRITANKLRRRTLNIVVLPADMCISRVHILILIGVEGKFGTLWNIRYSIL